MKTNKPAWKLALKALLKSRRVLAPEANGYKKRLIDFPYAKRAAEEYDLLTVVIEEIERMIEDGDKT